MKKVRLDQSTSKPQEYENTFPHSSNKKYSNNPTSNVSEIQSNPLHRKFSNDVERKLLAMSPMNLFFNKVRSSPKTHNDKRSLHFTDLLHPSLGNLQSSLQINFMVEYEWLMMSYEVTKNEHKPLTIIFGEDNIELAANNGRPRNNIIAKKVKPRYPFGTHHTKMMVLVYDDGSVRVVVHTSNLISSDWENRTQGIWVSQKCPVMNQSAVSNDKIENKGDSETKFKLCLLRYLNYYEVSVLNPFLEKIKACDFSAVNAFFVGSVPGSHMINRMDPFSNWGHAFVAKILRNYNEHQKNSEFNDENAEIILQSSSIGSLGPLHENSFLMELATSFNASTLRSTKCVPKNVKMVYPTKENVFDAYGGPLYGGGCLPYSRKTNIKQPWLKGKMCQWESEELHRTRAMPHIKSYTKLNGFCVRTNTDRQRPKASYYVLTSANVSKAAWGSLNKAEDKLFIQSYEAGILLLPKFTHGASNSTYSVTSEGPTKPAQLVLPYDLPLSEYEPKDEPWVMETLADLL